MATAVVAAGLSLGAAACGSSGTASSAASATAKPFGMGCASVPRSGPGSFSGMTADPVATAASHNPALSDLVGAVKKAGLVGALNSAPGLAVFAPDNAAFAKLPRATLNKVMADKANWSRSSPTTWSPARRRPLTWPWARP